MRGATTIDKEINNYLALLNIQQKKALLTVAKTFVSQDQEDDYSEEFKKKLDSRYREYEDGSSLVSEADMNKRISKIIKGGTKK